MERQWRHNTVAAPEGGYNGFKIAVAIIVFHFGVKMLVQFADLLLPFIMALLLVTILEPIKQATLDVLECTLIFAFSKLACRCCLKTSKKSVGIGSPDKRSQKVEFIDLGPCFKKVILFLSIALTVLLAGRLFWFVGQIVWLSGEAVMHDFRFYEGGVAKRTNQVQDLLLRFHLEKSIPTDMKHMGEFALSLLQYGAQFLSQHVFYTVTQVSLTAIFVLFLLFSPVQREFSPVMQGVFESMELYLKLKTFISLMMGVANGIALAMIGLELPAAWGLLTFLANFIPNIGGPVISIVPCVISILDERKTLYQVVAAFCAQFLLHFNIANFVEPIVFGQSEEIHSVVVLLGLSFFGYIWGFTGMFLSVPLLFAMHAWLDTIAKRDSYGQEACEDARFIMGMLEGRWLANSDDVGHPGTGVNLLTGHIEEEDWPAEREEPHGAVGHTASHEAHAPKSGGQCVKECFAVRDPLTGEVLALGLLLRWIVMAGIYTMIFFGLMIFHWDLHALIHPSGGEIFRNHTHEATAVHMSTAAPSHVTAAVSTSIAMAMREVITMAPPSFPFRGSPKLEGADLHSAASARKGTKANPVVGPAHEPLPGKEHLPQNLQLELEKSTGSAASQFSGSTESPKGLKLRPTGDKDASDATTTSSPHKATGSTEPAEVKEMEDGKDGTSTSKTPEDEELLGPPSHVET